MGYGDRVNFETLKGRTITAIDAVVGGDEVTISTSDGARFLMHHDQDCCEHVYLEDVAGDLTDLIGSPIVMADESSNETDPAKDHYDESYTWTFYKLATAKGYVTLRWYGTSNGYYSERVDFECAREADNGKC